MAMQGNKSGNPEKYILIRPNTRIKIISGD